MRRLFVLAYFLLIMFYSVAFAAEASASTAANRVLVILLDSGTGTVLAGAEAAVSKLLADQSWQPVSLDELSPPAGRAASLLKEASSGKPSAALELSRLSGIPYLLLGRITSSDAPITPAGVSLIMARGELSAKLYSTADNRIVKAFHISERSSAPDQTMARAGLHEKIAAGIVAAAPLFQNSSALTAAAPVQPSVSVLPSALPPDEANLAVVIGLEQYRSLPKSDYSARDAETVSQTLTNHGFARRNIELITNERATRTDLEKAVEGWLPNRVKPDSRVLIYFSGHGAPDPTTGDAYLMPFDGDPNYLAVTGYPLSRLYDRLSRLQVQQVTVIIDSCFSGSGGRSVLAKGIRSLVARPKTEPQASQRLLVFSSSLGHQTSTSLPAKGHGTFTYYLLQALGSGTRDVADIYNYLQGRVADEAKQQNVEQTPSISLPVEQVKGRFRIGS